MKCGVDVSECGEDFSCCVFDGEPSVFDLIVSGRVAWKEQDVAFLGFQECDDALFGMEGCVVENDGIAWAEFRDEGFFQPLEKEISIAIAVEDNRGDQA